MTLTLKPKINKSLGNQIPDNIKNVQSVIALKRYLDLTLTGTKKSLAEHGRRGRKAYPPSPYSFDKPHLENTIRQALKEQNNARKVLTPPRWVQKINEKICKHTGEAPLFSESLLPSNKTEQLKRNESRPMSGLSTKSAPLMINGEMYYRPNRKHTYLQASNRPCSAKENRETRASVLRNKHRMQAMSATPSNDTQIRLRELKQAKPKMQQLHKDLLPIPCHTGETPHSFIVGARYNCTSHMDSRSYARLGLYVPRKNPLQTFLKVYRGDDASTVVESDTDYVGVTSVRIGEDIHTDSLEKRKPPPSRSLPPPHVRKVVPENWLGGPQETKPPPYKPPSGKQSAASSKRSAVSVKKQSNTPEKSPSRSESKSSNERSRSGKSRSRSRTRTPPSDFNVQGRPAPSSPETEGRSRFSGMDVETRSRRSLKDQILEME